MASTCKSAGLVVMLMLAALVVSAHAGGHDVWVKNDLPTPIKCNGKELKPYEELLIFVEVILKVEVLDKDGKWVPGQCDVPEDVAKVVVFVKVDGIVAVKVVAVLGGLIHQLLGTVLGLILLLIKVVIKI